MANTDSAKKMVRKIARRTQVNRMRTARARGAVKELEKSINSGEQRAGVDQKFRRAQSLLQRAVTKGVMHKKTASRKIARLNARIRKNA